MVKREQLVMSTLKGISPKFIKRLILSYRRFCVYIILRQSFAAISVRVFLAMALLSRLLKLAFGFGRFFR